MVGQKKSYGREFGVLCGTVAAAILLWYFGILDDLEMIKAYGGTVNGVVLALLASATGIFGTHKVVNRPGDGR